MSWANRLFLDVKVPAYQGDPARSMQQMVEHIKTVSNASSSFNDIDDYTMCLAHEHEAFKDRLPFQRGGRGSAIHCISFAADMMTGRHSPVSDAQTKHLRIILRVLMNTPNPDL